MDHSSSAKGSGAYEAPSVTDLGRLEDLTKAGKMGAAEGTNMLT